MNEGDFVNMLRMMAANGTLSFERLDQELHDRYEAADHDQRRQLKDAVTQYQRIGQNLAAFSSIDARTPGS